MSTFNGYINTETSTIQEFDMKFNPIRVYHIINDSYSPYDCLFVSAGTRNDYFTPKHYGVCEAKTRNDSSEKYPEGAMLELDKLQGVTKKVSEMKDNLDNINKTISGFYLMKFKDKSYLFNLDTVDLGHLKYTKCPKNTAKDGNNDYVYKAVFHLTYDQAILTY